MGFKIKHAEKENLETFRVEVKVVHGDGDLFEILILGPFSKKEFPEVVGIEMAIKEMLKHDEDSGNKQEYEQFPYFRRFLEPRWKYDVFCQESNIDRYVMVKEYKFIYTDKDGKEQEVADFTLDEYPKYYYIKLHKEKNYVGLSYEDVITTHTPLTEEMKKEWGVIMLEKGEEFLKKYHYSNEEIDREDWIYEEEFLILQRFERGTLDDNEDDAFNDELEELEKKDS